jgi:hypothetical protein
MKKTFRYASRRSDDVGLRARLKSLASERRRFGDGRLSCRDCGLYDAKARVRRHLLSSPQRRSSMRCELKLQ